MLAAGRGDEAEKAGPQADTEAAARLRDVTAEIRRLLGRQPLPEGLLELRPGAPGDDEIRLIFGLVPPGTALLIAVLEGREATRDQAGGLTIYATYRHPATPTPAPTAKAAGNAAAGRLPAVLLIAGSGPTDRDGNSGTLAGQIGTLRAIADWLSADGVASLRYDKLGSGQTGLGPYASRPATIGIGPFYQEAGADRGGPCPRAGPERLGGRLRPAAALLPVAPAGLRAFVEQHL